jgi:hypothetical protein
VLLGLRVRAASTSRMQPLLTGHHCPRSHPSAAAPALLAPAASPLRSAPTVPTRRAPPAAIRAAQSHRAHAVPTHAAPHPPHSTPSPTPMWHWADPHPSPASPRLRSKESCLTLPCSPPFFSPSLSFTHGQSSPPHVRVGDRATVALLGVFPTVVVAVYPSTVRPTNPSIFPYLGPPSPLLSSPQLRELDGVTADPPSGEDPAARCHTEPPLHPVIAPPPR